MLYMSHMSVHRQRTRTSFFQCPNIVLSQLVYFFNLLRRPRESVEKVDWFEKIAFPVAIAFLKLKNAIDAKSFPLKLETVSKQFPISLETVGDLSKPSPRRSLN